MNEKCKDPNHAEFKECVGVSNVDIDYHCKLCGKLWKELKKNG